MQYLKFDKEQTKKLFHWNKGVSSLIGFRYHIKELYPDFDILDKATQISLISPITENEMTFRFKEHANGIGSHYKSSKEDGEINLWIGYLESLDKLEQGEEYDEG